MKKIMFILLIIVMSFGIVSQAEYTQYVVTASGLNVRQSPNTNSPVLGVVKCGSVLSGANSVDGWTPVVWNGTTAYVYSAYVRTVTSGTNCGQYNSDDLDLLSRVVNAEAGSSWLSDEHQQAVASVVLNRVADSRFPNTIREVVYQRGQYGCVYNGMINRTPSQRAVDNARYVLENGVTIPSNVVWQAQFRQGSGVWKYIEGHYFCY